MMLEHRPTSTPPEGDVPFSALHYHIDLYPANGTSKRKY